MTTPPVGRGEGYRETLSAVAQFMRLLPRAGRRLALLNLVGAVSAILQFSVPLVSARFIDTIASQTTGHMYAIATLLTAFSAASVALGVLESQLASSLKERSSVLLQTALCRATLHFSHVDLCASSPGHMMARITSDATSALELFNPFSAFGRLTTSVACGAVLMPHFGHTLGTLLLAALVLYVTLVVAFRRGTKDAYKDASEKTAVSAKELFESLTGATTAKLFSAEDQRVRRFLRRSSERSRSMLKARLITILANTGGQIIALGIGTVALVYGSLQIMSGHLTLGGLVGLTATLSYLVGPLNACAQQIVSIEGSMVGVRRVLDWMAQAHEKAARTGGLVLLPRRDSACIVFDEVGFTYANSRPLFRHVSFVIGAGETAVLSGPSGAGKTTLIHLLPRLLTPTEGRILIGGADISTLPLRTVRQGLAMVAQDTFLFSESVADNIRIGRLSASDAEVEEAARQANALEFIRKLPDGFNTVVGPRGTSLSGGQRQRIAIARALLRPNAVLILDEATTGIDRDTEDMIYDALQRLTKHRTTIIVSHHWEDHLGRADRHFMLHGNTVVECDDIGVGRALAPTGD